MADDKGQKFNNFSDSQIFRFKKNPLFVVCYPLTFVIFAKLLIMRVVLSIL